MGDLSGIPEDAILCTLDVVELYSDILMKREMVGICGLNLIKII